MVSREEKLMCAHSRARIKTAFGALFVMVWEPEHPSTGITKLWLVPTLMSYGWHLKKKDLGAGEMVQPIKLLDDLSLISGPT